VSVLRWIFVAGLLLCTQACGFHLRGVQMLPSWLSPLAIIQDHVSPHWGALLKRRLQLAHIDVANNPSRAVYWLTLHNEDIQKHIMSVSSSGSPRQYQLNYRISFTLQTAKGNDVIPLTPILVTRMLTINNDRILGSQDEEDKIIDDMRYDAAIQILYRLSATASPKPQKQQK